MINLIKPNLGL